MKRWRDRRKTFLTIARGSVQRCVPPLELARQRRLLEDAGHSNLTGGLEEVARMLSGLIRGPDKRAT